MNAGMVGADPQALREMARRFDASAHELMGVKGSVQVWVDMTDIWLGLNYHLFKDMWDTNGARTIVDAASIFHRCADVLRANADAQDSTSAADGGSGGGSASGLFGGGSSGGGSAGPTSAPPEDTVQLFRRLHEQDPESSDGVRIQQVVDPDGTTRFIVYINGTTQSDTGSHSGWDALISEFGPRSDTYKEIRRQMLAAGIDSDSEVLYVGYSQGGMLAQHLAASGDFGRGVVVAEASPRTSADLVGYDLIHINVAGDEVVTGVMTGGIVYDKGTDVRRLFDSRVGEEYAYTHWDPEGGVDAAGRHMTNLGKSLPALFASNPAEFTPIHTNMDAYERAAQGFQESNDPGAVEARRKIAEFTAGEVVRDTR